MEIQIGLIAGGTFLVIVAIFQAVEQRRSASSYRTALAESTAQAKETLELQREANRLLALIAEKINAQSVG